MLMPNPERRWFLVLVCHLDDSGESAEPVITCAGYLSTAAVWVEFEAEARVYFDTRRQNPSAPVTPLEYLHTVDLRQRRDVWDGWNTSETLAWSQGLFAILDKHVAMGFEFSVLKSRFNEIKKQHPKDFQREGSPFAFCFKGILSRILQNAGVRDVIGQPRVNLSFVIERGQKNEGGVKEVFDRYVQRDPDRLGGLMFEDKKARIALQASDFLVHFARRVRNVVPGGPTREYDLEYFNAAVGPLIDRHHYFFATNFFGEDDWEFAA